MLFLPLVGLEMIKLFLNGRAYAGAMICVLLPHSFCFQVSAPVFVSDSAAHGMYPLCYVCRESKVLYHFDRVFK
jgi:hypothetical protein